METCDPIGTPMETKNKIDLDKNGTLVDGTKYRSMIGALMYLTSSRSDIVHDTCLCARYQARPTKKHLKELKRIFRYLWGTVNMGVWYTEDSGFELIGFSDADHAGCQDTFKSTSGETQFLGKKMSTSIEDDLKAKRPRYQDKVKDIKIKIKIQNHKHAKGTAKEFLRIKGSKIYDVTRSEAISAMTTP
nr:uncharacterized mitochondrial protein AtMg00810-like [Tanacetum cinerariifolium]